MAVPTQRKSLMNGRCDGAPLPSGEELSGKRLEQVRRRKKLRGGQRLAREPRKVSWRKWGGTALASSGTVHSLRGIAAWRGIVARVAVGRAISNSRSTALSRGRTNRPRVRSEVLRSERRATGATRRSFGKQIAKRFVWTLSRLVPKDPELIVVHGLTDSEDGALAILERLSERGHSPVRLTAVPVLSIPPAINSKVQEALHPRHLVLHAKWASYFTSHGLFGGRATPSLDRRVVLFGTG